MEAPSSIIMDKLLFDLQVHTSLLFAVSMKNRTFCLLKNLKCHDSEVEKMRRERRVSSHFLKIYFFIEAKELGGERDHVRSGKQTGLYLHKKRLNSNGWVTEGKATRNKYVSDDNRCQKIRFQPTADLPLNSNRYVINKDMMK